MKVLFCDKSGDGLLDLAIRAKRAGHDVRYHLGSYDPVKRPVGRGLVERVGDWRGSMRWADLVLLGGNGAWMREMDAWKAQGVPIIGAGSEAAQWELDRLRGMAVFKRAGIPTPPFRHVNNYAEAVAYVLDRDEGIAIKPSGDVADKSLSFVAKSAKEAVWRLKRWEKEGKRFPQGLILQDRIEGIEFAVGAWFGPSGFAAGWEHNFEEKRIFAGSLGPNCGEAGTVMSLVGKSKLADKVLKPLEDRIHATGFIGNIDVNCIVDDEGAPWPLEFTVRFGYPAVNIEAGLHDDMIEYLAGLAAGKPPNTRRMNTVALGVVLAIPPYPFGHEKAEEVVDVPIWGVTPAIHDNLHFCDAVAGRGDADYATAGSYVLVATGTAETVVEARRGAHRVLDRLTIPVSPFWRNDIGLRLRAQLPKLQEHGYATDMRYS